jgi:hypothetical protein
MDTLKGLALITTCIAILVMTGAIFLTVSSASAASWEIEELCFEQLQKATLPLRPRGAGEAFMANCIANLTPAPANKSYGVTVGTHTMKRR